MKDKLTRRTGGSTIALVTVLAALGIGSVPIPVVAAAAASEGPADANSRPPSWAPASDAASSDKAPSLTNHVGMPESGTSPELWLGYALLGASLLVLAYGLAARATQRRRIGGTRRTSAISSSPAHVPAGGRVRR